MNGEKLFLAMGYVDDRLLERTERKASAGAKKYHSGKHRLLLIAAILVLSLLLAACAVARLVLFDSTQEMMDAIFGDKTGFDHKGITFWTDSEKPGSVYENPAFDRVPVDTKALEDVMPHISPVGQSITVQGVTLTVDAYLYDTKTRCGVVTYVVSAPEGLPKYDTSPDGSVWFDGNSEITFGMNQYGYTYLIPDKTTDTVLALRHYFRYDADEPAAIELRYQDPENSFERLDEKCAKEVREQYTPEEAIAAVIALAGEDFYPEEEEYYWGQRAKESNVPGASGRSEYAYARLRDNRITLEYQEAAETKRIALDITRDSELNSVTVGKNAGFVSPISLVLDARKNQALQDDQGGFMDFQSLSIVLKDGSAYVIQENGVSNLVFARISPYFGATTEELRNQIPNTELTIMFNRLIDVDLVEAVVIDGITIFKD